MQQETKYILLMWVLVLLAHVIVWTTLIGGGIWLAVTVLRALGVNI